MMKNENKFQIAGLEITPGERWQGTLMIGGGEFVLPAAVLHGEKEGKTVLMVSSEMPELLGVCDRILVMSGGRLAGEVDARNTTQEEIMTLAAKYV